jgi:tRNA U38,U39,U40 pseudouridine synthase TruA
MVRSMVALLMEAGRGRLSPSDVEALLARGERALAGRAAPPRGLTLERVVYGSATKSKSRTAAVGAGGSNESRTRATRREAGPERQT